MRPDALRLAGCLLIGVACAGSSTGSTTLAAQPVQDPLGCYRFNRPLGHSAPGDLERSTPGWWALELQPEGQVRRQGLTAAERMWVRDSHWSRLADTLRVHLTTGVVSWRIKLSPVSDDTLSGIAEYLSDVIVRGREPARYPVVAVREPCPTGARDGDVQRLERLNRELFESAIVRKDTTLWSAIALQQFLVIPPGGVLENRAQAFAGVGAFDVRGLTVVTDSVAIHDDTAVLVGRLTLDGEGRPSGRLGPLRFMNVFVRTDSGWKLLARSLTPCSERAVQAGRC